MRGNNSIYLTIGDIASNNAAGIAECPSGPSPKRLKSAHTGLNQARGTSTVKPNNTRPAPLPFEMSRDGSTAAMARERSLQPETERVFRLQLKAMEHAEAKRMRDHVAEENLKTREHEIQMAELRVAEAKYVLMMKFVCAVARGS